MADGRYDAATAESVKTQMNTFSTGADRVSGYNINNFTSQLSDFTDKTFYVGDNMTFAVIADEYIEKINQFKKEVDAYLTAAIEKKNFILACIAKDEEAMAAAEKAYNDCIANETGAYTYSDGSNPPSYHEAEHVAQANYLKEATWVANRCELWNK